MKIEVTGDRYSIDGREYVRVTTALSIIRHEYLERWRGDVGNTEADAIRDEARDLGRSVHAKIERIESGLGQALDAETERIVEAYLEWKRVAVAHTLESEQVVYDDAYMYAGRFDLRVMMQDGAEAFVDVKTGGWDPMHALQLGAYEGAWQRVNREQRPHRLIVLRLGKGKEAGRYWTKVYNKNETYRSHFLYALALYRFMKETRG